MTKGLYLDGKTFQEAAPCIQRQFDDLNKQRQVKEIYIHTTDANNFQVICE